MSSHETSYEELPADEPFPLLNLPDPCLLSVLQCCGDDLCSLFSIARAHSRLHNAVAALHSFQVHVRSTTHMRPQQHVSSALLYLGKHGQHTRSLMLTSFVGFDLKPSVWQLPSGLQLTSLQLEGFRLQLQPGRGFQGVLGAAAGVAALKQLRLSKCFLLDRQSCDV